ncbi:MAG: hypothetical protein COB36_02435 [Alphaproteobacteria bacterium]|nr:MAG: hypothetical protein COB36_02435 [Alphaproteobacteria bacterium]
MKKFTRYMVLVIAIGQLTACQTTSSNSVETTKKSGDISERVESALEKVALSNGSKTASLLSLEKKYKRNSTDPMKALAYAKGLRHANYLNRASLILTPFTKSGDAYPGINTEISMIALGLGNYDSAETYAQQAILQNPEDHNAYQNLGIALDAKEMHPEAERAFRKGLEHWKGDPTTIMNNLALNLATQGFIDEAIEVLERAQALSPDRIEIERNLRIIRTLNER